MRITTWAEYGVICALNLARRTEKAPVTGREIAAQERLESEQILFEIIDEQNLGWGLHGHGNAVRTRCEG